MLYYLNLKKGLRHQRRAIELPDEICWGRGGGGGGFIEHSLLAFLRSYNIKLYLNIESSMYNIICC